MLATAYALAHIAHWLQFSGGEPGGPVRLNARPVFGFGAPPPAVPVASMLATLGSLRTVVRRVRSCACGQ